MNLKQMTTKSRNSFPMDTSNTNDADDNFEDSQWDDNKQN